MTTTPYTPPTDEMDRCVVGDELVVGYSPSGMTLYHYSVDAVSLLGTFADVRDAWAAVDALDVA